MPTPAVAFHTPGEHHSPGRASTRSVPRSGRGSVRLWDRKVVAQPWKPLPRRVTTLRAMTEEWFELGADDVHVAREREKARALRKTAWWQRRGGRGVPGYGGKSVPPPAPRPGHSVPGAL